MEAELGVGSSFTSRERWPDNVVLAYFESPVAPIKALWLSLSVVQA